MNTQTQRSKRKYAKRTCVNPRCEYEFNFVPNDKRQIYCCKQCRINFHNDDTSEKNRTTFKSEKLLRKFDKKLAKIYAAFVDKNGNCKVWKGFLQYEGIDVRLMVSEQIHPKTGGTVKWFHEYGTELHPHNPDYFLLHKKPVK